MHIQVDAMQFHGFVIRPIHMMHQCYSYNNCYFDRTKI